MKSTFAGVLASLVFLVLLSGCVTAGATGPSSPAAAARFDDWIVIGPGGGGGQFIPTVSPHDENTACVRCDMTGSFITHDGGKSWRMFNFRSTSDMFVFDPVDPETIYARSVGLYRSEDSGRTWNLVHPDPESVEGVVIAGDHGETRITVKGKQTPNPEERVRQEGWGPEESVEALAIDPADSKTLYAAIDDRSKTTLCVSTDYGKSWSPLGVLPSGGAKIFIDPASPEDSRDVYVVGSRSVSLFSDGKQSDFEAPEGAAALADTAGGFDPESGALILYGITGGFRGRGESGVFVSTDGGRSWQKRNDGLLANALPESRPPQLRSIGASLGDGRVAYLSYNGLVAGEGPEGRYFGVAKTIDAGKTWDLVWKESEEIGDNMVPGWVSYRFGPGWGENPISIGVSPTNPDIVFTTDYGRTLKTGDGGKTWEAVYSKRMENDAWTTTGLDVTTCYGVHFDPFEKDRLFISYTDIGLFSSDDYGATWQSATTDGVPRRWVNTTYWMEFDPEVKGRAWAVMSGTHDLPRPKMWRGGGNTRQSGGICVTDDGGRTWTPCEGGMPQTPCTHVLIDPDSPSEARTLYVAGYGSGVWKSTDGGKTWAKKNKGIAGDIPFAWRMARDTNGVLYLVVARKSENGEYGNEEDGALYRSTDGAENWEKITLPEGLNGPNGITVDPEDPDRLYLAVWGRYEFEGAVMGGIWLSTDAGKTWKCTLSKDQYIYDVTVDPRDPNVLYACGFSSYAWRSADRGETWNRIRGFNFKWGHRVIPDPRNADMIFVTTFGGSVWYGPAKGDPDATEDIVTPIISYDIVD